MPLDWNILQPKHYYITKSWNLNVETVIFLWYITIKWLWIGAGHRYTYTIMWGDLWKKSLHSVPSVFCQFLHSGETNFWFPFYLKAKLSRAEEWVRAGRIPIPIPLQSPAATATALWIRVKLMADTDTELIALIIDSGYWAQIEKALAQTCVYDSLM